MVQIGSCGGLQGQLAPGDVVVPDEAICSEGIARLYGAGESVGADTRWSARARSVLTERGHQTHGGTHLTWHSIFAQNGSMVEAWHAAGYVSVDMETATTLAVAQSFGVPAVAMLGVWDELLLGRSFLDPLAANHQRAFDSAYSDLFAVALQLVDEL